MKVCRICEILQLIHGQFSLDLQIRFRQDILFVCPSFAFMNVVILVLKLFFILDKKLILVLNLIILVTYLIEELKSN